jgi:oligoribonuclease (3'-5' exoribonuclease)
MKHRLVFLDIETTGLDPRVHDMLEVAMVVRDPFDEAVDEEIGFAMAINLAAADPRALEVNRYQQRLPELRRAQIDDAGALALLMTTLRGAIVVGNNVQFDLRFIEQFLVECESPDTTPWFYSPVDLKALAAGRLSMGEPPWSTNKVADAAGVPIPDGYHSALVDAKWNRDVYDAVMNYGQHEGGGGPAAGLCADGGLA